jgi:hypothetical protein
VPQYLEKKAVLLFECRACVPQLQNRDAVQLLDCHTCVHIQDEAWRRDIHGDRIRCLRVRTHTYGHLLVVLYVTRIHADNLLQCIEIHKHIS